MYSNNNLNEQRQHINLSNRAFETLSDDLNTFSGRLKSLSGYINLILSDYIDDSEACISQAKGRRREMYESIILKQKKEVHKNEPLSSSEKQIIECFISNYESELIQKFSSFPKEKTLKIRLQNDVYKQFNPLMPESDYYEVPGQLIKAILEDYTSQPIPIRERTIYKNIFTAIISNIEKKDSYPHSLLKITYITASDSTPKKFRVKPYKIIEDPESLHNYLIGMSKPLSSEEATYSPAVFRITRILNVCEEKSYGSSRITKNEEIQLETALKNKGVKFIHSADEDYIIKLTPNGKNMYNNIMHLRPAAISNKTSTDTQGNTILHFHCTSNQIYNYFFKFGSNAQIISPETLAQKFKDDYRSAWEKYNNS